MLNKGVEVAVFTNLDDAMKRCRILNIDTGRNKCKRRTNYIVIKENKRRYLIINIKKSCQKYKIRKDKKEEVFNWLRQLIPLRKNHISWQECAINIGAPIRTLTHYYSIWKKDGLLDFEIEYNPEIHEYKRIDYIEYQKEYQKKHGKKYREKYKKEKNYI